MRIYTFLAWGTFIASVCLLLLHRKKAGFPPCSLLGVLCAEASFVLMLLAGKGLHYALFTLLTGFAASLPARKEPKHARDASAEEDTHAV